MKVKTTVYMCLAYVSIYEVQKFTYLGNVVVLQEAVNEAVGATLE